MIARLPFLEPDECARAVAAVDALRRQWTPRHPALPSFTLGAAAYLDVPLGLAAYQLRASRSRRLLERDLGWVHARLAAVLEAHLSAPVALDPGLAAPGVHAFLAHPRLHELTPSLHFDLQHLEVDRPDLAATRAGERVSFTAALELPASGGGLDLWDVHVDDCPRRDPATLAGLAATRPVERFRYALGELFVHDGDHLHRIAAAPPMASGERRLTLQGHGARLDGRWWLYW